MVAVGAEYRGEIIDWELCNYITCNNTIIVGAEYRGELIDWGLCNYITCNNTIICSNNMQ